MINNKRAATATPQKQSKDSLFSALFQTGNKKGGSND
jgi:hypothetical protein